MAELAVKSLLAYLLGSIAGALLLGQWTGGDIRREGSGNAGATNALRTRGPAFAAGVLAIDFGKGWLAAALLPLLPWPAAAPALGRAWLDAACAAAVVIGHVYPVWYGFRGGKGAATLLGTLTGLAPPYVLPVLVVWLTLVLASGYVGLATMAAAASFPVALLLARWLGIAPIERSAMTPLVLFGVFATAFTLYTHRANIARMRSGTEHRARRFARPGVG